MIDSLNANFSWPETDVGDIFTTQCPCRDVPELTNGVFAIRVCGAGGRWMPTDYSVCLSDIRMAFCRVCMHMNNISVTAGMLGDINSGICGWCACIPT